MLVNAVRGYLAEYGVIVPQGLPSVPKLIELAENARGTAVPELAWRCIRLILAQLEDRIAWAVLQDNRGYRAPAAAAA
jgi:transposase